MRDFNIDIGISNMNHGKLERFCSLFNLKYLIKKETCITKTHNSTIDLILTNKPIFFHSSIHKLIANLQQHLSNHILQDLT